VCLRPTIYLKLENACNLVFSIKMQLKIDCCSFFPDSSIRKVCYALDLEDNCNKRIKSDVLSCRNPELAGIETHTKKPKLLTHTVSLPGDDRYLTRYVIVLKNSWQIMITMLILA